MQSTDNNQVVQNKQRIYAQHIANLWLFGKKHMPQAKSLTDKDIKKVLNYISTSKYAARDRAMLLCTVYGGMRIGEASALTIAHVLNADGTIKDEARLTSEETKGDKGRTVMLAKKLQQELRVYLVSRFGNDLTRVAETDMTRALFYTQKESRRGFSANTAAQHFGKIYKEAGITGASSHSGRRTFLTNLGYKGVGVRVLMQLAGHKNLSSTQKYLDCNEEVMREAIELL